MTSGILISLLLVGQAPHCELDLPCVFEALAAEEVAEVGFIETRESDLLVEPLEVTGSLRRDEEGRLIRAIQTPEPETQILTASHVEIQREDGRQRRFQLKRAPELEVLYRALSGILAADAAALSEHFELKIEGEWPAWRLILRPRSEQLAERVQRLTVCGSDARITRFNLHLSDGEIIRTRILTEP